MRTIPNLHFAISAIKLRLLQLCFGLLAVPLGAQSIPLANNWSTYDPIGLLSISNQSAGGFTAFITTNATGSGNIDVPRVYQHFPDQPFTNNGTRVAVTFDLVVNHPMVVGDTQFRFGLANTNVNEIIYIMYDIGVPGGTVIRSRMDPTWQSGITRITNELTGEIAGQYGYAPTIWNHSHNSGANLIGALGLNSPGLTPNATGLGVAGSLSTKHSFRYSVERTPGQLLQDAVWSNDAGSEFVGASGFYDEFNNSTNTPQTWEQINAFGFHIFNNAAFGTAGGSYTVSNLKIYSGFKLTAIRRDGGTGDVELTWESSPYDSLLGANYIVEYTTNLTPPIIWTAISTNTSLPTATEGFWTSFTNAATTDHQQFYRVYKVYP